MILEREGNKLIPSISMYEYFTFKQRKTGASNGIEFKQTPLGYAVQENKKEIVACLASLPGIDLTLGVLFHKSFHFMILGREANKLIPSIRKYEYFIFTS